MYVASYTATVYIVLVKLALQLPANSKDVRTCNCFNEILSVLLEYIAISIHAGFRHTLAACMEVSYRATACELHGIASI